MNLSAPIYRLKRQAKLLARTDGIPLHEALDRIALQEGYGTWSLLIAQRSAISPASKLLARLIPGNMVLVGARPGQGKTLMSLELAVEAMKDGRQAAFFTLEYTAKDILDRFRILGVEPAQFDERFTCDCSDDINADYIMAKMTSAPQDTLIAIDYLQLLDQKRENPPLAAQVGALRSFARKREVVIVLVSQIDRSYDPVRKPCPDMDDIRLPNPLDLQLFDQLCFLNEGEVRFHTIK